MVAVTVAVLGLLLTGCTATSGPRSGVAAPADGGAPPSAASSPGSARAPGAADAAARPRVSKLLVIVEENHAAHDALAGMPYLASVARSHARATDYHGVAHPSLPNYLAIAGGSTFGVTDDEDPSAHRISGQSVFGQVLAAHRSAKTYAEGMPSNCYPTNSGRYGVRHNPWTYFVSERSACQRYDVPLGTPGSGPLHDDLARATLPTFGLVVPDTCHDAHDCSLATADGWLRGWLPAILSGPDFRAGRLAVVVTFDEDDDASGNHVLTVVLGPRQHGSITVPLDHYSLSAAVSRLVGAPPLRSAARARDLLAVAGLR